jgi:hypothetical protein
MEGDGVVRSTSELDSAAPSGESATQRRSSDLREQEAHDVEGLGDKTIVGAVRWLETEGPGGQDA